ncbi:crotonase/enoyl-CoA hydratase family protein [Pseudobacteriovorax antillogorgiicola]|uniref:Enoyl-CoA hydratase/carnithine racemase n=1 Tax=Pseudobacteriovorax antillogorgiicola TaxID=1513793 RepID=A0A1Y6C5M1_9BACT|nr:crotonase/enoyl-CoA hydratase family protein [Pseudobacteriovorax antillogorgiicola]TCS51206.1 enoyl-CoA hydratase/carnithine racemase [Pseudobacteriovorax antillogorgiicola]SMF37305.1 Enoyl-CoA hydratase/carnithine racemase [Pseudobacteriovorax antillogorgiicola]
MSYKRLLFENKDQIVTLKLNRADKLNAFDLLMFEDISKAIDSISRDRSIRAVVVGAEGSDFSTGLDIKSVMVNKQAGFKLLWKWWPTQSNLAQKMSVGWRRLSVPVIMAIHGRCWGAGMQTALGGDFRFASPDASLAIMESRWGLIPDMGGSLALREITAMDRALDWTMTSREIPAMEALEQGLISKIEPDPMAAAQAYAQTLAERSPDALAGIKKLYQYSWHHNDGRLLAKEWLLQWKMFLGKNRGIAVQKAQGKSDRQFVPRAL